MECEILFRGKRVGNGEWTEGLYSIDTICSKGDFYLAPVIRKKTQKLFDTDWDEVIPETVGRFTGLTDRNGVKIFEGDILEAESGNRGYVMFINGAFMKSSNSKDMPFLIASDVNAVIGNIHDNPELLKGEPNV